MNQNSYRFRFYLNANHYIFINGKKGNTHPHTWEIVLYISKINNDFFEFTNIEKKIDKYLSQFEGILLNEHTLFAGIDPTSENISARMLNEVQPILNAEGWQLESLEISENPTRSFIIKLHNNVIPNNQGGSEAQSEHPLPKPLIKNTELEQETGKRSNPSMKPPSNRTTSNKTTNKLKPSLKTINKPWKNNNKRENIKHINIYRKNIVKHLQKIKNIIKYKE